MGPNVWGGFVLPCVVLLSILDMLLVRLGRHLQNNYAHNLEIGHTKQG
jgi:hypothetical protein